MKAIIGEDQVRLELIGNAGHMDPVHYSPENINRVLDFLDFDYIFTRMSSKYNYFIKNYSTLFYYIFRLT